jgi:hypothetical protein
MRQALKRRKLNVGNLTARPASTPCSASSGYFDGDFPAALSLASNAAFFADLVDVYRWQSRKMSIACEAAAGVVVIV